MELIVGSIFEEVVKNCLQEMPEPELYRQVYNGVYLEGGLHIFAEIFDFIAICGIQHGKHGGGAHQ